MNKEYFSIAMGTKSTINGKKQAGHAVVATTEEYPSNPPPQVVSIRNEVTVTHSGLATIANNSANM